MTLRRSTGAGFGLRSLRPLDRRESTKRALAAVATAVALVVGSLAPTAAIADDGEPAAVIAPTTATLTGDTVVGGTVTVASDAWTPADATLAYTWWRATQPYTAPIDGVDQNPDATPIDGADAAALALTGDLVGQYVWAVVTGSVEGSTPASVVAATTTAVRPGTLVTQIPTFVGTIRVDSLVSVNPGTWPEDTTFSYKWRLTDTSRVTTYPAVTGPSYTLPASALGKKLSVVVTVSRPGYISVQTYSPFIVVAAAPFGSVAVPTITGGNYVGATLTAVPGAATPAPSYAYQWRRSGVAIAGATKSTYKTSTLDIGKVITVTITARRTGYTTVARTSAGTLPIVRTFAAIYAPTVSGSYRVGNTLTASVRAWSPAAGYSYQWRRDGVAIAGATKSTYVLTPSDLGTLVTVVVTGKRSGYYSRSLSSAAPRTVVLAPITLTKNGLYEVGTQIAAGTYVATGGNACYFERRSDANIGEDAGLLGVQYFYGSDFGGQKVITIDATDEYFYTEGCGVWKMPSVAIKTTVGDGTWVVGKDISAGLWRVNGPFAGDGCFISWHGSFTGDPDVDILDGGYVESVGDAYYIYVGDKGFTSDGCGTWKRIGN